MDLGDVEWGDVLSDVDGVLVVEGLAGERDVLVKRYAAGPARGEIAAYALLRRLGVPTLKVLGAGEDWLILEAPDGLEWRIADPDDLHRPETGSGLAAWYDVLHAAGSRLAASELDALGRASDVVTDAGLAAVASAWPELAPGVDWAAGQLPGWRAALAELAPTLNHPDGAAGGIVVSWSGDAWPIDLAGLTAGYRGADLRGVPARLNADAAAAFAAEYARLLARRGQALDPREAAVDEPLAHLVALVGVAAAGGGLPWWAAESYAWLAARS